MNNHESFPSASSCCEDESTMPSQREDVECSASPEVNEQYEAHFRAIEQQQAAIEAEAEKLGVLDRVRNLGKWYRSKPYKYKVALTALLITASSMSAAVGGGNAPVIASAVLAGSMGQRTLGSLATFTYVESELGRRSKEKGIDDDPKRQTVNTLKAVGAAGAVFMAGNVAKSVLPDLDVTIGDYEHVTKEISGAVTREMFSETVDRVVSSSGDMWDEIQDFVFTSDAVNGGSGLALSARLEEGFGGFMPEQLQALGISSEDLTHVIEQEAKGDAV
jgi:hypothetical protein